MSFFLKLFCPKPPTKAELGKGFHTTLARSWDNWRPNMFFAIFEGEQDQFVEDLGHLFVPSWRGRNKMVWIRSLFGRKKWVDDMTLQEKWGDCSKVSAILKSSSGAIDLSLTSRKYEDENKSWKVFQSRQHYLEVHHIPSFKLLNLAQLSTQAVWTMWPGSGNQGNSIQGNCWLLVVGIFPK